MLENQVVKGFSRDELPIALRQELDKIKMQLWGDDMVVGEVRTQLFFNCCDSDPSFAGLTKAYMLAYFREGRKILAEAFVKYRPAALFTKEDEETIDKSVETMIDSVFADEYCVAEYIGSTEALIARKTKGYIDLQLILTFSADRVGDMGIVAIICAYAKPFTPFDEQPVDPFLKTTHQLRK